MPCASPLKELALTFLKLGTTSFGGPAAHIAMMEDEVVRRKGWLTHAEFLDMLGMANLIPGPNSTEMAIHVGLKRAGWKGLLVSGTCFIFPAMLIVWAIAWAYVRFGSLPAVTGVLSCVKPVVIAIVIQALWRLGRTALKTQSLAFICALAIALTVAGANELIVLFGGGGLAVLLRYANQQKGFHPNPVVAFFVVGLAPLSHAASAGVAMVSDFSLPRLFLIFLKIGSVLFGSGYVLLAFLKTDFVEKTHWLTQTQLLDAVAVGQFTPGPVFTTATFIGYLIGGNTGALLATIGIFLPAFFFVAIGSYFINRLRRSPVAGSFLDGVNVSSLALMAVVTVMLARSALTDSTTWAIAIVAAIILLRFRLNSMWLVLAGGLIGGLRRFL